ncbi:MAG TPA: peptidoglycan-binding protein [Pseudolabrys sp.]|nr:peptidoglycan-binding protein [Pseudolabrys sp.]
MVLRGKSSWLVLLLALGASPAVAQDDRIGSPDPVQVTEAPAAPNPDAAKPATPRIAALASPIPLPKAAPRPVLATPAPAKSEAPLPRVRPEIANTETAKVAAAKTDIAPAAPSVAPNPFAAIPLDERLSIQSALLWSGDYPGAANGEDPMLGAIKNYQKRVRSTVTGELTPGERANLIAAAKDHEQEFGWTVVADPATGVRIGLPAKMVPLAREAARGTRWSSAHGEVQIETFRIKEPDLKLATLFEQEKKQPSTRRIEYSVLRDDGFFISGIQGLKNFSVRATMRDGEVRGFTIMFDQAMETIVAPVTVAMASAFSPFPERSAPFAALSKSVEYGNGLVVSERGHIVTDRKLTENCQVIVAAGLGDADRVADDKATGLALLRVYGARMASPLALPQDAPKNSETSDDVTLIGIPDPKEQDRAKPLTEIKARLDGSAIELRQPVPMAGLTGAAALDAQGHVLGMTAMRNAVVASTEATAPPVRLVGAGAIRDFLSANNVAPAQTQVGDAKASVVRIICVRK